MRIILIPLLALTFFFGLIFIVSLFVPEEPVGGPSKTEKPSKDYVFTAADKTKVKEGKNLTTKEDVLLDKVLDKQKVELVDPTATDIEELSARYASLLMKMGADTKVKKRTSAHDLLIDKAYKTK